MGEGQGLALGHVRGDVALVDVGLHLVVDEDHDNVAPLGGLGNGHDLQAGLLGNSPVLGALTQAHDYVAAGVLQVKGMGMTLGTITDHGDFFAAEITQFAIFLIKHFCHS
ncbi:hypothetical protein SDC9_203234 [bioreactor metagenome]|uniref:Uncharacterized protein n=1 Tax=bioreactor metagenome TaxID=1076179 RepID=A0A645IXC2_9ZZZZ